MSAETDPPARVGTVWTYNLRQPPVDSLPMPPQVTFRRVGPDDIPRLAGRLDAQVLRAFDARLHSRRRVPSRRWYTAWAADRLAGYGWVSFGGEAVGELGVRLQLAACEAYLWDFYTHPAYRNQHIYAALLVWTIQSLAGEGLCRAWIGADFDNLPSQRGIDRAGFLRVADLLIHRQGRRRRLWLEGYPGVPAGLVEDARRVFLGGVAVRSVEG